ncbi:Uncharacterised protein [Staphylococcus aureus]|nr:Uncharacterised protein [Staphylococcus aureus]
MNAFGANLVVVDNAIGDIQSSPNVTNKKLANNQTGLINVDVSDNGTTIIIYESPAKNTPIANL